MCSIVAICGLKRSGKDVVANYISNQFGHTHVKIAHKLKQITKLAFDFSDEELETSKKDTVHPRYGVSPRVLMDFLGTQVFQHDIGKVVPLLKDNRCFWIDNLLQNATSRSKLVISDLRFHHELERLQAFLCENRGELTVIRVQREGTSTNHFVSEMESDTLDAHYVVQNNGTLSELYAKIDTIMCKKK